MRCLWRRTAAVCEPLLQMGDVLFRAARAAGMKTVLLTRWSGVASRSTLEVSPTNKDFYRAHKFKSPRTWRRAAQSTRFGARTCDVAYVCVLGPSVDGLGHL